LAEFVRAFRDGRYDRTKGRLSSRILGIAHHTALRLLRAGRRDILAPGTAVSEIPDEREIRSIWEEERDREILSRALAMLRDESSIDDRTLLAFELFALRGVPVAETARRCEMTVDQVYVAKSRITRRLRTLVDELTEAFEEDS
jgi:DNA-directed RNA polymerase specialized sigma24 family protein